MSAINLTRDQLLEQLQARMKQAQEFDAKRLAEHRKAEQAYLKEFRDACREAVKWDYATAKTNAFRVFGDRYSRGPECPVAMAAAIDRAVRQVNADPRNKWRIVEKSPSTGHIYHVLTWSPDAVKSDLCS